MKLNKLFEAAKDLPDDQVTVQTRVSRLIKRLDPNKDFSYMSRPARRKKDGLYLEIPFYTYNEAPLDIAGLHSDPAKQDELRVKMKQLEKKKNTEQKTKNEKFLRALVEGLFALGATKIIYQSVTRRQADYTTAEPLLNELEDDNWRIPYLETVWSLNAEANVVSRGKGA